MGDEGNGRRKGEKGGETRRGPNRLEISRLLPARRSACKSRPVRFWHPRPAKKLRGTRKTGELLLSFVEIRRHRVPFYVASCHSAPVQRSAACTSIIREWRMRLRAISSYRKRDEKDTHITEKEEMRGKGRDWCFMSNTCFISKYGKSKKINIIVLY